MSSLKIVEYLATILLVCQVTGYVVSQKQQPELASFGDFMEFHIGLHKACERAPGGSNTTEPISSAFTKCVNNLSATKSKDYFGGMTSICENRDKYFVCWDQMKTDTLKMCGSDKESVLPALYISTVTSLCGEDNGKYTIESLKKASAEISQDTGSPKCPEETGIHWIENCEDILPFMYSDDLCARHKAIDTCLGKITCDNLKFGKILRKIYTDGKSHLKCSIDLQQLIRLNEHMILNNHEEKVVSSFFAMVIILTIGYLHNYL